MRHHRPPPIVQGHRNVDDNATSLRLHHRKHRLRTEERAVQINLDDRTPRVRAQRLARRVEVPRGTVDEEVDPALVRLHPVDDGLDALRLPDVELMSARRQPASAQRIDCWTEVIGRAAGDGDVGAQLRQQGGDPEPDSGATAGDEGDLSCEKAGLKQPRRGTGDGGRERARRPAFRLLRRLARRRAVPAACCGSSSGDAACRRASRAP